MDPEFLVAERSVCEIGSCCPSLLNCFDEFLCWWTMMESLVIKAGVGYPETLASIKVLDGAIPSGSVPRLEAS